jgi:hypothetical protein
MIEPALTHLRPVLHTFSSEQWNEWRDAFARALPFVQTQFKQQLTVEADGLIRKFLAQVLYGPAPQEHPFLDQLDYIDRKEVPVFAPPPLEQAFLYLHIELLTADHPANRATAIAYLQRELTCRQQIELGVSILTYGTTQEKANLADFIKASGRMFDRSLRRLANHPDIEVRIGAKQHLTNSQDSNLFSDF